MNIRQTIGERLRFEAKRCGLDQKQLAKRSGVAVETIGDYMQGAKELIFEDISSICHAMGANPFWLMSKRYKPSKTHFRHLSTSAQKSAREIEQAFYLIAELLPSPGPLALPKIDPDFREKHIVSGLASKAANEARQINPTPEGICKAIGIQVIAPSAGNAFDAFLLRSGEKVALCVNKDSPPNRIIFSLLHELAHLAYHKDLETTACLQSYLFSSTLKDGEEHEFIADKFAQHFLIPYEIAEKQAIRWPNIDTDRLQNLLDTNRVSLDVLSFALWEALDNRQLFSQLHLSEVKGVLDRAGLHHGHAASIYDFLLCENQRLSQILKANKEIFSDPVYIKTWRNLGFADHKQ